MRRRFLSCLLTASLTISCMLMTSCIRRDVNPFSDEPQQIINLYENDFVMENYMKAVQDYDHTIYEEYYDDFGGRSIGPTEKGYRGVVYLTEDEAQRLWDEYEWEESDGPASDEFLYIEPDQIGEGPWYTCSQFNSDNFKTVMIYFCYFNGTNLVYHIHQM